MVSFLQGISINLERNAFKGEKSRIVSCDICQIWAILVSMFPSFPRYKEGTGRRGQIEPGPPVIAPVVRGNVGGRYEKKKWFTVSDGPVHKKK